LIALAAAPATQEAEKFAEAERWVRQTYARQFASRRPEERVLLAKLLLEKGKGEYGDPARRRAMLLEARNLAVELGEVDLACAAAEGMSPGVEAMADVLAALAGRVNSPQKAKAMVQACLKAADNALAAGKEALAERVLGLAEGAVRTARDDLLAAHWRERRAEVTQRAKDTERVKLAEEKLKTDPADPVANGIIGRRRCFEQGDWKGGLPLLERGDDLPMQLAAMREKGMKSPAEILAAADAWWEVGGKQTGAIRLMARQRAKRFYEQSFSASIEADRTRAQGRLLELINTREGEG
jgi:hypothetical protein